MKVLSEAFYQYVCRGMIEENLLTLEDCAVLGNIPALLAALLQCAEDDSAAAPGWVLEKTRELLIECCFGADEKVDAPAGKVKARIRQYQIACRRYDEVEEILEGQRVVGEQVAKFRALKEQEGLTLDQKTCLRTEQPIAEALGRSKERAYQAAEKLLEGDRAQGAPDIIKKNYYSVSENIKRYRYSNFCIQYALGLGDAAGSCINQQEQQRRLLGHRVGLPGTSRHYVPKEPWDRPARPAQRQRTTRTIRPAAVPILEKVPLLDVEPSDPLERAVKAGSLMALLDGLRLHQLQGTQAPGWLLKQAFKTLVAALRQGAGLHNLRAECRHDIEKFVRFWMVEEMRMCQRINKALIPARTPIISDPEVAELLKAFHSALGTTLRKAARMASLRLGKTRWAESPGAIEKSYYNLLRDKQRLQQYWIPLPFRFPTHIPGVWDAQTEKEFRNLNPQT